MITPSIRVFAFPGKLEVPHFQRACTAAPQAQVVALMVRGRVKYEQYRRSFCDVAVFRKECLDDVTSPMTEGEFHSHMEPFIRTLLSDPRTLYLAERTFRRRGLSSAFNAVVSVEMICWNALSLLSAYRPDRVVFQATPHHIRTWVFGRCAEMLGIPVTFTAPTVLPWLTRVVRGIDEQEPVRGHHAGESDVSPDAVRFYQRLQGTHREAMPAVDRRRLDRYRGRFWSTRAELREVMRRPLVAPFAVADAVRKARCLRLYKRLATPRPPLAPYVLLLLHYQPERTTLPEGGWYSHQWLIIRVLSHVLRAKGWRLRVKEHPSVFRLPWSSGFRNGVFYQAIHSLDNVDLVPLDGDTFQLIDGAVATATVTGTAIFESICRNVPVLVFGRRREPDLEGLLTVESHVDVANALDAIAEGRVSVSETGIRRFLASVEANAYPKDPTINTSVEAYQVAMMCPIEVPTADEDSTSLSDAPTVG